VTPGELRSSIFNRLQVCEFAEQATIDDPKDPDKVQQRAANIQKQLRCATKELRELLGMEKEEA
jgi:hypothetical protein